jgi:hypothetical protein
VAEKASAALTWLEKTIAIIDQLRNVDEPQKDLVAVLEKHDLGFRALKSLIQTVKAEKELQTEDVGTQLRKVNAINAKLIGHLERTDPGEQLGKIEKLLGYLHGVMLCLLFDIQIAGVGVVSIVGDIVIANLETISRIDRQLIELFGEGKGLRIARLLKDDCPKGLPLRRLLHRLNFLHRLRSVGPDGMVYLKRAEVEDLQYNDIRQSSKSPVAEKASGGGAAEGEVKSAHYVAGRAVDEEEANGWVVLDAVYAFEHLLFEEGIQE